MAFLRQDEFQPALDDAFRDVVIVNEAHKAAKLGESPSKRSRMVERAAGNSDLLLLPSATPHNGQGEAFRSLVEYIFPFLVAEAQDLSQATSSAFHSSRCGSPNVWANRPGLTG